jgi:hypothetical protein
MSTSLWNHLQSEATKKQHSLLPPLDEAPADVRESADDLKIFEMQRRPSLPAVPNEGLADLIAAIRATHRR